jgi:hypothetical protein
MSKKNSDTPYCQDNILSEDEAILYLAEGWSTESQQKEEIVNCSYYKKAFADVKAGKPTWNWRAALGGVFWLGFHGVFFLHSLSLAFYTLFFCYPIILFPIFRSTNTRFFYIFSFFFFGYFGNKLLFLLSKRRYKNGCAFLKNYKRGSFPSSFWPDFLFVLFISVLFYIVMCVNPTTIKQYLPIDSKMLATLRANILDSPIGVIAMTLFRFSFELVDIMKIKTLTKKILRIRKPVVVK